MDLQPRSFFKTKRAAALFFAALLACACLALAGCGKGGGLTPYVSEYRSRLYAGTEGEFSVFASFTRREVPYLSDGNVGETTEEFTVAVTVPDNTKLYTVEYSLGGQTYASELSFNSVRMVHTCSQTLPEPAEESIAFKIADSDGNTCEVTAKNQAAGNELGLADLLDAVRAAQPERFAELEEGGGFAGEIHVRLLHEDEGNYYYVGITDRAGRTFAMLADAVTGEVLATKEP